MTLNSTFSQFSRYISHISGQPFTFILACSALLAWGITGPIFEFSNTWQLAINSMTTIVTFIMVFIIQNTQNRDGEAIQIKLDELIRSHPGAHNVLLDLEELTEDQLKVIKTRYEELAERARQELLKGKEDTLSEEV